MNLDFLDDFDRQRCLFIILQMNDRKELTVCKDDDYEPLDEDDWDEDDDLDDDFYDDLDDDWDDVDYNDDWDDEEDDE